MHRPDLINNKDEVVGWSEITAGLQDRHAFVYTKKHGMEDLNNLIDPGSGWVLTEARGINDAGKINGVGLLNGQNAAFILTPILYAADDLGTLGGTSSGAIAVNAWDQVVGESQVLGNGSQHAFSYYDSSGIADMGTLGGANSGANDINDFGLIVGYSDLTGNSSRHAFRDVNGVMTDIGTLGGANSTAWGTNASGQIAGESWTSGNAATHAFLYNNGTMTDLGTLGGHDSFAYAVNSLGHVTGQSLISDPGKKLRDLGTLGGLRSRANGINAAGHIVGYSDAPNGYSPQALLHNGQSMLSLITMVDPAFCWQFQDSRDVSDGEVVVGWGHHNAQPHAFRMRPYAVISNITITQITSTSVVISWNTLVNSTTLVKFGTTVPYSNRSTGAGGTSHSVKLIDLTPNTSYHYQVTSIDQYGRTASSADQTFTTSP